jgi:hypothetical protein
MAWCSAPSCCTTKNKDAIYYQNLNLGAPTAPVPMAASCTTTRKWPELANWNVGNNSVSTATGATTTAKALSNLGYGNVLLARAPTRATATW